MLAFRPLGRRVINFTDLESQKGFVYLPFLSYSSYYSSPLLMGSVLSSWLAREFPSFSFRRLSVVYPPVFSLSLLISVRPPHFQLCSVSIHRNSVRIQRADTVVQLKSGSDRKLQYSGSCTEKRKPEANERYRQTLRDRINRMESKVVECFRQCNVDQTSGKCYVQHFKVI